MSADKYTGNNKKSSSTLRYICCVLTAVFVRLFRLRMGRRGMGWHGRVGTGGGREIDGKEKRREGVGN